MRLVYDDTLESLGFVLFEIRGRLARKALVRGDNAALSAKILNEGDSHIRQSVRGLIVMFTIVFFFDYIAVSIDFSNLLSNLLCDGDCWHKNQDLMASTAQRYLREQTDDCSGLAGARRCRDPDARDAPLQGLETFRNTSNLTWVEGSGGCCCGVVRYGWPPAGCRLRKRFVVRRQW
jgi:hypothetical protein